MLIFVISFDDVREDNDDVNIELKKQGFKFIALSLSLAILFMFAFSLLEYLLAHIALSDHLCCDSLATLSYALGFD